MPAVRIPEYEYGDLRNEDYAYDTERQRQVDEEQQRQETEQSNLQGDQHQ